MGVSQEVAKRFVAGILARAPLVCAIEEPKDEWDRFDALRKLYAVIDLNSWDPYIVDWMKVFTPIERMVWGDLRSAGVKMWPQLPVGSRFMDFADPELRIAIECDGKDWHDLEKDAERDTELGSLGWTVFRVTGSDCVRTIPLDDDADMGNSRARYEMDRWLCHTSESLVEAIAVHYHGRSSYHVSQDDAIRVLEMRASRKTPFYAKRWTGTTAP